MIKCKLNYLINLMLLLLQSRLVASDCDVQMKCFFAQTNKCASRGDDDDIVSAIVITGGSRLADVIYFLRFDI